jgi:hypothetical protein
MDKSTRLAYEFVQTFNDVILFPTIGLLSAVALLVFIFGAFQYVVNAADPAARQQGIKHITWGIVGLVVMLSAYTIMLLFANTFGLGGELDRANSGPIVNPISGGGGGLDNGSESGGGGLDNNTSGGGGLD